MSPLMGTEALEQICLFVRGATRDIYSIQESKEESTVEGMKGRSAVFISPLNQRLLANQVVENATHIPKQMATTKRVSAAKSFKFTHIHVSDQNN